MRWIASTILALGLSQAYAHTNMVVDLSALHRNVLMEAAVAGLNWKVGDKTDHSLTIAGFLNGTMKTEVTKFEGDAGIWTVSDIDLTIQKQHVETLYDKNTGKVIKMIVDGKEQTPQEQDPNQYEVVSTNPETIKVKAGSFDTVHIVLKDKKSGQNTEAWINLHDIPISGEAKLLAPTQIGQLVLELASFVKN